jgi:uncharacterized membrane protein YfcA
MQPLQSTDGAGHPQAVNNDDEMMSGQIFRAHDSRFKMAMADYTDCARGRRHHGVRAVRNAAFDTMPGMPFPAHALVLAPIITLLAYAVLAIGGFGSALLSIPLLALLLPVKTVVPLVLIVDFVATAATGLRFRQDVDLAEIKPLVPWMLIGLIAGISLLVELPSRWVLVALGLFVLGYAMYSLASRTRQPSHSRWWSIPAGLIGGVVSGMVGVGGPVYVIYLSGRLREPARLRASLSTTFSVNTAARLALFLVAGLLFDKILWLAAAGLLPFMAFGLVIGHRIHVRLTHAQIARFVSVMLLLSGLAVLWKALLPG